MECRTNSDSNYKLFFVLTSVITSALLYFDFDLFFCCDNMINMWPYDICSVCWFFFVQTVNHILTSEKALTIVTAILKRTALICTVTHMMPFLFQVSYLLCSRFDLLNFLFSLLLFNALNACTFFSSFISTSFHTLQLQHHYLNHLLCFSLFV